MECLEYSLSYAPAKPCEKAYPAVIVAAGSSSRMKGTDKQFLSLLGIPVLARTLCVFENSKYISSIVVVAKKEKIADVRQLAEKYGVTKLIGIAEGGSCREESVQNGVRILQGTAEKAIVHDGARPLVTEELIGNVAEALAHFDSVTCAVKVKDTVKEIDQNGIAVKTVDRESLVNIQTPQGIDISAFLKACESLELQGFTDDTSVLETVGIAAKTVPGDYKNMKVTTPEDIAPAEAYLSEEL